MRCGRGRKGKRGIEEEGRGDSRRKAAEEKEEVYL